MVDKKEPTEFQKVVGEIGKLVITAWDERDAKIDGDILIKNQAFVINRSIKKHTHKITKIITGTTLIFNNVPYHIPPSAIALLCDRASEIDFANIIIVNYDNNETALIKNRWGKQGSIKC